MKLNDLENELEMQRQILCKTPTFNPYHAFNLLSKGKDNVTNNDIKDYLQLTYNPAFPQNLNYKEFLNIILPIQSEIRTETTELIIELPWIISTDAEKQLKNLLTLQIKYNLMIDSASTKNTITSEDKVIKTVALNNKYKKQAQLNSISINTQSKLLRSFEKKHNATISLANTFSEVKTKGRNISEFANTTLGTQNNIKSALQQQLSLELLLEESKKSLSLDGEFDIKHCFAMLTDCSKDQITLTDLIKKFKEMGINHTKNEAVLFLRRYGDQGKINLQQFYKALSPFSKEYKLIFQSATYVSMGSYTTSFINTLTVALDVERKLEKIRVGMHKSYLYNAYKEICGSFSAISLASLSNYLEADAQILFEMYDKDKDNRITYMEFIEELCPKAPFL